MPAQEMKQGEKRVGKEKKKCFRIMVNTQMTSLWGGQKPPTQSFGGHI